MKKSTKLKLIRALTSSTDYNDKDKLRLIKNLLDETLPSSTIKTKATEFPIIAEDQQYLTTTSNPIHEQIIAKLPQKLADRVLELYKKDRTYQTLPILIEGGFAWGETTEGYGYWQKLHKLITHFQTLPQPYQDQAIKNIDMDYVKGSSVETPELAIVNGFEWSRTEQGQVYWDKLYYTL